jgi:hypothetical protein
MIPLTKENVSDLSMLAREFGFSDLRCQIADFLAIDISDRVVALEEQALRQSQMVGILEHELLRRLQMIMEEKLSRLENAIEEVGVRIDAIHLEFSHQIEENARGLEQSRQQTQTACMLLEDQATEFQVHSALLAESQQELKARTEQLDRSKGDNDQLLRELNALRQAMRDHDQLANDVDVLKRSMPSHDQLAQEVDALKRSFSTQDNLFRDVASLRESVSKHNQLLRGVDDLRRSLSSPEGFHPPPPSLGAACPFEDSEPLSGIISRLCARCGGKNIHDAGLVSAIESGHVLWAARHVLDLYSGAHFRSLNRPDQWVGVDFKDTRVLVTHYSLCSASKATKPSHPRSWVLEASVGGTTWVELDRRNDNDDLIEGAVVRTFRVRECKEPVRMVRIRQTAAAANKTHCLEIAALELFGSLIE